MSLPSETPFNSSTSYNKSIAVLNRAESSAIASSISFFLVFRCMFSFTRIDIYHADVTRETSLNKHKKKDNCDSVDTFALYNLIYI